MTTVCRCPDMKFDVSGSVVPLPQGTDPDCPSCYPDARASWGQQCTAERPFGPCIQHCEQVAGHDGQHRAQCSAWDQCPPHDIHTYVANLWSGPFDRPGGGVVVGKSVSRWCTNCLWEETTNTPTDEEEG